jgi:integrase/recombinase XerD
MDDKRLIDEFITSSRVEKGLSEKTLEAYRTDLDKLSGMAAERGRCLLTLERNDLVVKIASLKKSDCTDATIQRFVSTIRGFYRYALREGYIKQDPASHLEARKSWQSLPRFLSQEEVDCILEKPDLKTDTGMRDRAMLEVLYATGVRVSELVGLRLDDVDLEIGVLNCFGKGSKQRRVPLGRSAISYLKLYLAVRHRLLEESRSERLFVDRGGRDVSRQKFWMLIKGYGRLAGIDHVTPHLLRHSFATALMSNGADRRSVQMMLAHSNTSTGQIHTHMTDDCIKNSYRKYHPRS